jgi:hypothetical protein
MLHEQAVFRNSREIVNVLLGMDSDNQYWVLKALYTQK